MIDYQAYTAHSVTVSLPQLPVIDGNVQANIKEHVIAIKQSADNGAHLVVFPELSLTGYAIEQLSELAFEQTPEAFSALVASAVENNIAVIAGCPLIPENNGKPATNNKPAIGSVICFADGRVEFYAKQYLHPGEDDYCSAGKNDYSFSIKQWRFGLAICADFAQPKHSQELVEQGIDAYLVSALISPQGYNKDAAILSGIASQHQLPVLLTNHISPTGGWQSYGNNSVWDNQGKLALNTRSNARGNLLVSLQKHCNHRLKQNSVSTLS